jgi:phage tail-like protein
MAWKERVDPHPAYAYAVYEVMDDKGTFMGGFDMLTGGEQKISTVSYNVIDKDGNVTTRFMPGQTTFTPISLLRAVDKGAEAVYDKFIASVSGKLKDLRKNYSISMNDAKGKPVVWWDLINTIPIKVSGFDFNMKTESVYTDFTIDLQAEYIEITFLEEA